MKVIPFKVPQTRQEAFRLQEDRHAHFYDQLHQHSENQIMWIVKSEGTLIAGDYVGRFQEGDLFLIGSGQPHVFRNDDAYFKSGSKRKAEAISMYFDESYTGAEFWRLNEMKGVQQLLTKSKKGLRVEGKTKTHAIQLIRQLSQKKGIDKLIHFFQLLKVLSESRETHTLSVTTLTTDHAGGEDKRMNDILHFTFRESYRPIYLREIAEIANLSQEAFCRYFKLRTQKTYTNFLNEVRISKACQLLIGTDKTVQEICYEAGFNNVSQFNRVFRKITGKTPNRYLH